MELIEVLDHGYIKLLRVDGTDRDIENSARASFIKSVDKVTPGFIERLAKEGHSSPFRCVGLWFEIKMPGAVKNQFYRHVVSNAIIDSPVSWNEVSFRGVHNDIEFYTPHVRAATGRWGQGDVLNNEFDIEFQRDLKDFYTKGLDYYNRWIVRGASAEHARSFLPFYNIYTVVRSRMSLEAACHFYKLRSDSHAQLEIQQYAAAIDIICGKYFPISWEALKAGIKN